MSTLLLLIKVCSSNGIVTYSNLPKVNDEGAFLIIFHLKAKVTICIEFGEVIYQAKQQRLVISRNDKQRTFTSRESGGRYGHNRECDFVSKGKRDHVWRRGERATKVRQVLGVYLVSTADLSTVTRMHTGTNAIDSIQKSPTADERTRQIHVSVRVCERVRVSESLMVLKLELELELKRE